MQQQNETQQINNTTKQPTTKTIIQIYNHNNNQCSESQYCPRAFIYDLFKQSVTEDGNEFHHCEALKRKKRRGKLKRDTGTLAK